MTLGNGLLVTYRLCDKAVVIAVDGAPSPSPSLPPGAMPRGSCDGPAQARRACSGAVNSAVRRGPPRARACARGVVFVVMWVVGPCASFASPAPGRTRIGRDTHVRSAQRRRASPLRAPRRACTQRTQGASTHAEVGWGWWISLILPGAPCAMRTCSGRGRHARDRQERRAPPSRTPPRARPASTARYVRTGHGARTRCSFAPALPTDSARPAGRHVRDFHAENLRSASVRAWTRPRTHKRKATKGSNFSPGHRE